MNPGSMESHFGADHGAPVMDRVHEHCLFKKGLKVEMSNKHYGLLQPPKIIAHE